MKGCGAGLIFQALTERSIMLDIYALLSVGLHTRSDEEITTSINASNNYSWKKNMKMAKLTDLGSHTRIPPADKLLDSSLWKPSEDSYFSNN